MNRFSEKMNNNIINNDYDISCCYERENNNCDKGDKGNKGDKGDKGEKGNTNVAAYIELTTNSETAIVVPAHLPIPFLTITPNLNINSFTCPGNNCGLIVFSLPGTYHMVVTAYVANATDSPSSIIITMGARDSTSIIATPRIVLPVYQDVPPNEYRLFSSTHIVTVTAPLVPNNFLALGANIPLRYGPGPAIYVTIHKID